MTDFDYDCYQKKNVARSASKRKCGSKSKKCTLPSDGMTIREWNERCGDVVSYHINKPMLWAEFQKLPKDLKEEYLNSLIEKYSANARNMADMFGVNPATVFRVVKNDELNVKFLKGKHPAGEKLQAFQSFLIGEQSDQEAVQDRVEADECTNDNNGDVESLSEQEYTTRLDHFTMDFSGNVNVEMIANSLRYILSGARSARIHIECALD